jgi:PKD repeat protein
MGTFFRRLTLVSLALSASAACTTSQSAVPAVAGPSELALSLRVTATPDSISQDGASQSAIVVKAFDANGKPCATLPVHLDMAVNNQIQDYGTLSTRNVVTASDGTATSVYTAPPPAPPSQGGAGSAVVILATPSSSYRCGSNDPVGNFDATNQQLVSIRLVPVGVILPPASKPTAKFTFPTPVNVNVATLFDGTGSCPNGVDSSGACLAPSNAGATITSYSWSFGDGSSATGATASHTFRSAGVFVVTLTVTNDRGATGSTSQSVTTATTDKPSVDFVWSPQPVLAKATTTFNGSVSTAASGHQITSYAWDFGDGTTGNGASASHAFATAQTYKVVLTVTDDTGQQATTSKDVAVLTGNPVPAIVASPGAAFSRVVTFDATNTQTFGGATIASYLWNFGDPSNSTSTAGPRVSFTYPTSTSFTVQLTVTDSLGRSATTTVSVTAP